MQIRLNGEPRLLGGSPTLAELLAGLHLETRGLAVEMNGAIVPRSLYGETRLDDGDAVEIVRFIGGG